MFCKLNKTFIVLFCLIVQGCDKDPLNDPYPHFNQDEKTLYTAFTERPKHLDPAISYSAEEAVITYQVYESPLQYHYLKRPYELVTQAASEMPVVTYIDKTGKQVKDTDPSLAYSLYRIQIKPGIRYQAHPAFAKDDKGQFIYHDLKPPQVENKHKISDFEHTGTRELVAQDYIYEIKRLADPRVNSPIFGLMENYIVGFSDFSKQIKEISKQNLAQGDKDKFINLNDVPLEGVRLIDSYTYEIKVKGKYPQFMYWLAMPFFAPIPWEAAKFYSQDLLLKRNISLDWYPIGTGPFVLTENNPNAIMVLERNQNFHGEAYPSQGSKQDEAEGLLKNAGKPIPFLDKIIFILEKENIPYWNKFLQGYYDQSGISSNNFDQAIKTVGIGSLELSDDLKSKGIRLSTSVAPTFFYWGFNMLDETVGGYTPAKRKLRQAIAIAMDMEEYVNIFLNGSGMVAQSPIPPGIFGYRDNLAGINQNIYNVDDKKHQFKRKSIAFAKKLLKEAGYPNGIDPKTQQPLVLYYDTAVGGGPDSQAQLAWIRKQFDKLGIDLVVRSTQYNRFQDKVTNGDFQLFSWGWSADYPDPENFLFLYYSENSRVKFRGENTTNYSNSTFDNLFEQMKVMQNSPDRNEIIDKMLTLLEEDTPYFGGFYPKTHTLRHDWVGAFKTNEMSRNGVKYISLNVPLRNQQRNEWNKPIIWPLFLGIVLLIGFCIPAGLSYWQKMHKPLKLRNSEKEEP